MDPGGLEQGIVEDEVAGDLRDAAGLEGGGPLPQRRHRIVVIKPAGDVGIAAADDDQVFAHSPDHGAEAPVVAEGDQGGRSGDEFHVAGGHEGKILAGGENFFAAGDVHDG